MMADDEPHSNWQELVTAAQTEDYNLSTPLPIPDASRADVVEHAGKLWIPHQHLLRDGYSLIEPFQVVKVNGVFYELQGHVGKSARNLPGGAWWVEKIDPDEWAAQAVEGLPVLSDEEYAKLQATRRGPDDQGHA